MQGPFLHLFFAENKPNIDGFGVHKLYLPTCVSYVCTSPPNLAKFPKKAIFAAFELHFSKIQDCKLVFFDWSALFPLL